MGIIVIAQKIRQKLSSKSPAVSERDIEECFANRDGVFLIDDRADNLTNPLTRWFISETDHGLKLKICFIPMSSGEIVIKTAYSPNEVELGIYSKHGKPV